jgi:mono/diheme cytochrome c family protein
MLSSILLASCALAPMEGMAEEWEAPPRAAKIENPVASDQSSIAAGKTTYQHQCLACHGSMGKGDGRSAIGLEPRPSDLSMPMMWKHSDGALFWKITEGRAPMTSFKTLLTDDQRWQVVNYIRTLAARPEGPVLGEDPKDTTATGKGMKNMDTKPAGAHKDHREEPK